VLIPESTSLVERATLALAEVPRRLAPWVTLDSISRDVQETAVVTPGSTNPERQATPVALVIPE
jgi:hypothetical protein